MKHQAIFSSKDKSKKNSAVCCRFLFGALRVKIVLIIDNKDCVIFCHT